MDPEHANTIPISEILGKLEVKLLHQQGVMVYYPSLWDNKRGAMLVMDTATNRWWDTTCKPGTLIELVCRCLKSGSPYRGGCASVDQEYDGFC